MIWKIKMMSGQEIPLEDEAAVMRVLEMANKGMKLVLTKYGVVNCASIDSIVPHREKMEEVAERLKFRTDVSRENMEAHVLGRSPFSGGLLEQMRTLGKQMEMLGPAGRTAAQEEAAKGERKP